MMMRKRAVIVEVLHLRIVKLTAVTHETLRAIAGNA